MVTRDTAAVVRDAVVDAIDPLEIILFGSIAREASGRDIDLLVVTKTAAQPSGIDVPRSAPRCGRFGTGTTSMTTS